MLPPTTYKRLEDAFRKELDCLSRKVKITVNPDKFDDTNTKAIANVRFIRKDYSTPNNKARLGTYRQDVNYIWELQHIYTDLKTHQPTYVFIEKIEEAFSGSDIARKIDSNFGLIWIDKVEFNDRIDDNCWMYTVTIGLNATEIVKKCS